MRVIAVTKECPEIKEQAEEKERNRAYQLGLSLGNLAVILLQDFFQLLPLRFFFLLDG